MFNLFSLHAHSLDCDGIDGASDLEAALLELHDRGVVDARALGEDQDGQLVGVFNVLAESVTRKVIFIKLPHIVRAIICIILAL